jgi:pyridinium-3,5-bisthiocarboxylic acid mononucleotide nickel chelatase
MRICYLDCFSGISGDMLLGALVDAGADPAEIRRGIAQLGLEGVSLSFEKTSRRAISATQLKITAPDEKQHRHLSHIEKLIQGAKLLPRVEQRSLAIFRRLGEVEAAIHQIPVEKVHFHEVGAIDSIVDIVGTCLALEALGIDEIHCSPLNVGSGTVECDHGTLPVPAPATAALLAGKPVYARGPALELTTPTGAAVAATLSASFGPLPAMHLASIGYGAGGRDFPEHANVLRVLIGERSTATEAPTVAVIEANIDDLSPQVLAYASERLMDDGALDVSLQPLLMKKGRPGTLLRVIARPEDLDRLAQLVFAETSTLGLRIYPAERRVLAREFVEVETAYGKVRLKVAETGSFAPEYEDCRRLAAETGTPLRQILSAANAAYRKRKNG